MRVKICGITSVTDAAAAVQAGVDAIGLNFVGGPRRINADCARGILTCLPPMVTPVALVNVEEDRVADPLEELFGEFRVSHLQVYGDVTRASLTRLMGDGFRPIPVVAVRNEAFADRAADWIASGTPCRPCAVHLDAFDPGRKGGTGKAFRWEWVSAARDAGRLANWPPIVLAGGLNADNVAEAIRIVQPYAVDVSSGVEVAGSPGTKDAARMRSFVRQAKSADETTP